MNRTFIFIAACCLVFPTTLSAQTADKIVIESSLGKDISESLGGIFMQTITTGLTNSGRFEVLTNRDEYMAKLGGELRAQESGLIDDRQMLELGRAAGAKYVAYVRLESFDEEYIIFIQMTELETGISKGLVKLDPIVTTRAGLLNEARNLAIRLADGGEKSAVSKTDIPVSNVLIEGGTAVNGHIDHKDRTVATWVDAVSVCDGKGEGWRLPTIDELEKIYRNRSSFGSSPGFQRFQPTVFWSSSQRNGYSMYGLDFSDGSRTYVSKTSQSSFRCVRNI